MTDTLRLRGLKEFQQPDQTAGVNKLYFLEVKEKIGMVKIGDTHRDVLTRNSESIINASLHPIQEAPWLLAEKWDGSVFRDKSFHKFLESKNYARESNHKEGKSEWFFISLAEALVEFEAFIGKPAYKVAKLRAAQAYLLNQLQEAIDSGHQYINAGFCVRVGKTILSLQLASNNDWMPVYLGKNLNSQNSAESDNAEYGIVPTMTTESLHGVDELQDGELSKKAQQIIKNIDANNKENKRIVFFVDEVDDASHTKNSRDIITPVVEHYKAIGEFACIITMSGTRVYRGEKILKELTQGDIKQLSLEYYEMQILQQETTCNRNFRHISYYSQKTDGLTNISDAMKNKDEGHKSLSTSIAKIVGTNNFDIKINPDCPHWFMKFSTQGKDNANKLVTFLTRNHSTIENTEYVFAAINGDVTKSKAAQDYCHAIIAKNTGKTCVFISQGMATTSFSVPSIGNSVVFTDNEISADDTQALHRSATWQSGKAECNMLVVTTNDSREYSFADIFEDETKIAKDRSKKIKIYRQLLTNNSMIHFSDADGFRPVEVTHDNAETVIDKKLKAMTKIASFMIAVNELDDDLKDAIFETVTGNKSTTKKSNASKADKFEPFGPADSDDTNNKKKASGEITVKKQEAILRAFVESAVNVPAVAREQSSTIEEFEYWDDIAVSKELFFDVYNSSWMFKDRIDTIYGLCADETYLIDNYIDKLVV
jgi:hypothetical protein